MVAWRQRYTPDPWKSMLEIGLQDTALFEQIRSTITNGRPLGNEASVKEAIAQAGTPRKQSQSGEAILPLMTTAAMASVIRGVKKGDRGL